MNRVNPFLELIEAPPPPPPPRQSSELVQPLRDLADALSAKALVGAGVQTSDDGRRHHLFLWPLHRPAFRSVFVTVQIVNGRGAVLIDNCTFWFTTAEELTERLENLVKREDTRSTLEDLRAQAREPVDARLERANGMATLAGVSPEQQEMLDRRPPGEELSLDLELRDGEPVPDGAALRGLDSAGLRFQIREASVSDRTVHLRVVKPRP